MKTTLTIAGLTATFLPTITGQAFFVQYTPGGDDTSVQRIDPIINPGTISQHVHQLFGGSNLAATLDTQTLQGSSCTTVGAADGQQNTQDHSIYWVPSLYMQANDGSGYVRIPTNGHKTYYIDTGEGEKVEPFEFPDGFRMVAGDPQMRSPDTNGSITWTCFSGGSNVGSEGSFPSGVSTCETYPYFNGEIEFPHCWNGDDFNPASPYSHVAYPPGGDPRGGTCPPSHPKRLPHLFIETFYMLDSTAASQVKANTFTLSQGDTTGYGFHADFFNGWDTGAIPDLLASCPPMNEDIGKCPNFKGSGATSSCSLPTQFKENVDTPSPGLPGCNPVTDESGMATDWAPAPLGTDTDKCKALSGASTNGNSSAPAASSASPAASSPSMAATSGAATAAAPSSAAAGSWDSSPAAAPSSPSAAGYIASAAPANNAVETTSTSFATVVTATTSSSAEEMAETPAWMSHGGWRSGGGWNEDRAGFSHAKARRHLHRHQHVGRSFGMRV